MKTYRIPKVTPNTQTHLKTHYLAPHCTSERRNQVPCTRTPTKTSLTRTPWQPFIQTQRLGKTSTIKRNHRPEELQKAHSRHSNLNKMKRQRNTHQVKEHEKCPTSQTKEEEIGNLPEKEFRIMTIKKVQKSWKLNGVTDNYPGDKDWKDARNV